MAANADFLITRAGLNAALQAEAQGAKIKITQFTIGSGFGYTPTDDMTEMQGDTLFTDKPSSFKTLTSLSKLIVCKLPTSAGPFTYGEIALWLEDGTMFALCVFDEPLTKLSSLEDAVSSSATFNCILTLEQGASAITIDYEDNPDGACEIEGIDTWANVKAPSEMNFPMITSELIVSEKSINGNTTLLTRDPATDRWSVASEYQFVTSFSKQVSGTKLTVSIDSFDNDTVDTTPNVYLIQFNYNTFRVATGSVSGTNAVLTWRGAITNAQYNVSIFTCRQFEYLLDRASQFNDNAVHVTGDETIDGTKTFLQPIIGTAQAAQWSDYAERYEADYNYNPGTLICFGGAKEITIARNKVNGVISTKPGVTLNRLCNGPAVALAGRVPVSVKGIVNKHDKIVLSNIPGTGVVDNSAMGNRVIGRALESKEDDGIGLVECVTRFTLE